jgi:hypothetical protein
MKLTSDQDDPIESLRTADLSYCFLSVIPTADYKIRLAKPQNTR